MDPHGQPMHDEQSQNFVHQQYLQYHGEESHQPYPDLIPYSQPQVQGYPMHPGHPPRGLSDSELQQAMHFQQRAIPMLQPPFNDPNYGSPPHGGMPLSASPHPQSPTNLYAPPISPVAGSDTSGEPLYHSRSNSTSGSSTSSRASSLVHRHIRGYHPTPSPTSSTGRRSRGRSVSDDEDQMGAGMHADVENLANTRKEATRRQRIEAEQRRRDDLRDGYARLKDVLPVSNQKNSKVALLERACHHIQSLEKTNLALQTRLSQIEAEVTRLREINEKISLGVGSPSSVNASLDASATTPSREGNSAESSQQPSTPMPGQEPSGETNPSPPDGSM